MKSPLLFRQNGSSFHGGEGVGGLGHDVWNLLVCDASSPVLDVDLASPVLVVETIEDVLEGLLLDDDANLLNAAVETSEVEFSRVVDVEELELFDQEGLFTSEGVRFELDLELEFVLKTVGRLGRARYGLTSSEVQSLFEL